MAVAQLSREQLKKRTKDQLIDYLGNANDKADELGAELDESRGEVWKLQQGIGKVEAELREVRYQKDFFERILKRLVGMA